MTRLDSLIADAICLSAVPVVAAWAVGTVVMSVVPVVAGVAAVVALDAAVAAHDGTVSR
ncbi:hypothetical protein [Phenylobacterium sp.]|uniref:hypothetical protein n=1 Tax=Phenylobacterium sp. TaxID=1871053 RepID=UPI0025DC77D7|nr:hypothetical protein [Phenylobacterium sp.]